MEPLLETVPNQGGDGDGDYQTALASFESEAGEVLNGSEDAGKWEQVGVVSKGSPNVVRARPHAAEVGAL